MFPFLYVFTSFAEYRAFYQMLSLCILVIKAQLVSDMKLYRFNYIQIKQNHIITNL